jgi:hypothetical protein
LEAEGSEGKQDKGCHVSDVLVRVVEELGWEEEKQDTQRRT